MNVHRLIVSGASTLLFIGLIAMVLLLAGCAGSIIRSEVPVAVRCVEEMPVKPKYRVKDLPSAATDAEKVKAIVLDWLDSRPYEAELEAGLSACR